MIRHTCDDGLVQCSVKRKQTQGASSDSTKLYQIVTLGVSNPSLDLIRANLVVTGRPSCAILEHSSWSRQFDRGIAGSEFTLAMICRRSSSSMRIIGCGSTGETKPSAGTPSTFASAKWLMNNGYGNFPALAFSGCGSNGSHLLRARRRACAVRTPVPSCASTD